MKFVQIQNCSNISFFQIQNCTNLKLFKFTIFVFTICSNLEYVQIYKLFNFPNLAPKSLVARLLGSGVKTRPHPRPQKLAGAPTAPINEPPLPRRPLRGRILLGALAARGWSDTTGWPHLAAMRLAVNLFYDTGEGAHPSP
jgi:hypothetical protein